MKKLPDPISKRQQAIEMLQKGYSVERVREILKMPFAWVREICTENGFAIKHCHPGLNPQLRMRIVMLYKGGNTVREIADKLGMNRSRAWRMILSLREDGIIK